MSVVLAVKNKDKIILATDSQVSYGGTKRLITNPNSYKIWRPAGHQHLIVGGVGALRDLNILSTVDVWFDEYVTVGSKVEDFELTFSYVVRTLAPALRREIADFVGDLEDFNSYFIFAYKDKCFEISPCGAVSELIFDEDVLAIGSGGEVARTVYSALDGINIPVKEKILRSLSAVCKQDLYVSYPIIIMDTNDTSSLEMYDGEYLHLSNGDSIHCEDIQDFFIKEELENKEKEIKLKKELTKEPVLEVIDAAEVDKYEFFKED